MILPYGEARGNGRAARRLYQYRFPQRPTPSHTLFAVITQRLQHLYNTTDNHFEIIAPDTPTFYPFPRNQRPDILDIALIKNCPLQRTVTVTDDLGSDHLMVELSLVGRQTETELRTSLNYKRANWHQFREDLAQEIVPEPIHNPDEIDAAVTRITTTIQTAILENIPKTHKVRNIYLPPEIRDLMRQRNLVRRQWQRHHHDPNLKRRMNHLWFRIHVALKDHVTDTWNNTLSCLDTRNMKQVWNLVKKSHMQVINCHHYRHQPA